MQTVYIDPDQMSHFMVSDLGLHCLPVSFLWDTRLKWVNVLIQIIDFNWELYVYSTKKTLMLK